MPSLSLTNIDTALSPRNLLYGAALTSITATSALLWNRYRKQRQERQLLLLQQSTEQSLQEDLDGDLKKKKQAQLKEDIVLFYATSTSISWSIAACAELLNMTSSKLPYIAFMAGPTLSTLLVNKLRTGKWRTGYPAGEEIEGEQEEEEEEDDKKKKKNKRTWTRILKDHFLDKSHWKGTLLISAFVALTTVASPILFPSRVQFSADGEHLIETYIRGRVPDDKLEEISANLKERLSSTAKGVLTMAGLISLNSVLLGMTVNATFCALEEIGWRGFLLPRVRELGYGTWSASYVTGAMWGAWHFATCLLGHNYPVHRRTGTLLFTAFGALISPLFTITLEAIPEERRTLAASSLHGVLNAMGGTPLLFVRGGDDFTVGVQSMSGLAVLGLGNIVAKCWLNRCQQRKSNSTSVQSSTVVIVEEEQEQEEETETETAAQ